jgi:hypothetical protein
MSLARTRLIITTALATVLIAGCGGKMDPSTIASPPVSTTTPAVAPTTTTVPPLSGKELAWLTAITRLHETMDKALHQPGSVELTRQDDVVCEHASCLQS